MQIELILFLIAQAIALLVGIAATYTKTAVRLRLIEDHVQILQNSTAKLHDDHHSVVSHLTALEVQLRHIETMQDMLCAACPYKILPVKPHDKREK